MQQVGDPHWQIKHKTFDHVAPNKVYESFKGYIEALDVRGHTKLAASLHERVTPDLCEKYPKLLLILKSLAKNPPNTQLPVFARETDPTWQEIMDQEPLEGDHWQEQQFTTSEDEDAGMVTPPPILAEPELPIAQSTLVIPDLPSTLDTAQLIQEIKYKLLGFNALLPYETNLTNDSFDSLLEQVNNLNAILDACRVLCTHEFAGYAFEGLRTQLYSEINGYKGTSILQAMLFFRKLLVPWSFIIQLIPFDYMEMLDHLYTHEWFPQISKPFTMQLSLWASTGQLGPLLSVYQPTLVELIDDELELKLPHFVNARAVADSGKYAQLCSSLGISCSHTTLVLDYTLEHQILSLEKRNLQLLLQALKPQLLREWTTRVAPVYLVQDTRLMEFVLSCVDQQLSFTRENETAIAAVLKTCWFEHEFRLKKLVPHFEFGSQLVELLLPLKALENQWVETILALIDNEMVPTAATKDLALELEAYNRAAVREVADQIRNLECIQMLQLPARVGAE